MICVASKSGMVNRTHHGTRHRRSTVGASNVLPSIVPGIRIVRKVGGDLDATSALATPWLVRIYAAPVVFERFKGGSWCLKHGLGCDARNQVCPFSE